MPMSVSLHIVILQIEPDIWCDFCGSPCAITVTYIVERGERAPEAVGRVTYCESCDDRG